jgi:fucose permease
MRSNLLRIVAFLSFLALGLPDGMLGVAWPSISTTFRIPLGSLGVLMAGFTVGYVVTTALIGTLISAFGYGAVLIGSVASIASGGLVLAGAPGFGLAILATVLLGIGSGLLDGGLNAYGAAFFRPRDLNWLHAFYGVGATIGPAIMTPMIIAGPGWRGGYIVVAGVASFVTLLFVLTRRSWDLGTNGSNLPVAPEATSSEAGASSGSIEVAGRSVAWGGGTTGDAADIPTVDDAAGPSRRQVRLITAGSITIFFLYTGMEVVAGQWVFSLFTLERGISAARAGTWVAFYWAALTAGRIVFGWISERIGVTIILRGALAGVGLGMLLLLPSPFPLAAPIGLAMMGFFLAPIFPLLIGETPRRVGVSRANHLIGFQIAAANIGAVSLVAAVGGAVETIGLEVVPWALLITLVLFVAIHEALHALTA